MTKIDAFDFSEPHILGTRYKPLPGVYVVSTQQKWLDVGITHDFSSRINPGCHDRENSWRKNAEGYPIFISVKVEESEFVRSLIERALRLKLNPSCGER